MYSDAESPLSQSLPIHVCFCADGEYINFVIPAVESIVRSAAPGTAIAVDIIVDKTPDDSLILALELLCPGMHKIHVIDADQFSDLLEVTHITRGMYYRLMIPELVNAEKVLYLDCDVLVRKDLGALFKTPLGNMPVAAVINPFLDPNRIGIQKSDGYFNSGVMLINTSAWRSLNLKNKVLRYLRETTDALEMPDQDALNVLLRGRWVELSPTYNCQFLMLRRYKDLAKELQPRWSIDFLNDPAIMHFSSGHKQWHRSNRIRYSKEYRTLRTHLMVSRRGVLLDCLIGHLRQLKYAIIQSNPYFY